MEIKLSVTIKTHPSSSQQDQPQWDSSDGKIIVVSRALGLGVSHRTKEIEGEEDNSYQIQNESGG